MPNFESLADPVSNEYQFSDIGALHGDSEGSLTTISWSPVSSNLLVAATNNKVHYFSLESSLSGTHSPIATIDFPAEPLDICWSPDGQNFAVALADGKVAVYSNDRKLLIQSEIFTSQTYSIAWSKEQLLAVGSSSGRIKLLIIEGKQFAEMAKIEAHTQGVNALAFNPIDGALVSASADRRIIRWDLSSSLNHKNAKWPHTVIESNGFNRATDVQWNSSGSILACSGGPTVRIYGRDEKGHISFKKNLGGHVEFVQSVAFSGDDSLLASRSNDGILQISETKSNKIVQKFTDSQMSDWRSSIDFSNVGNILASVDSSGKYVLLKSWETTYDEFDQSYKDDDDDSVLTDSVSTVVMEQAQHNEEESGITTEALNDLQFPSKLSYETQPQESERHKQTNYSENEDQSFSANRENDEQFSDNNSNYRGNVESSIESSLEAESEEPPEEMYESESIGRMLSNPYVESLSEEQMDLERSRAARENAVGKDLVGEVEVKSHSTSRSNKLDRPNKPQVSSTLDSASEYSISNTESETRTYEKASQNVPTALRIVFPRQPTEKKPSKTLRVEVNTDSVKLLCGTNSSYRSPLALDSIQLIKAKNNPSKLGPLLFNALFNKQTAPGGYLYESTERGYNEFKNKVDAIELDINSNNPLLHSICWESLAEEIGQNREVWALDSKRSFYRTVGGHSTEPEVVKKLNVLVAICSPKQLGQSDNTILAELPPLPVETLRRSFIDTFSEPNIENFVEYKILDGLEGKNRATLNNIESELGTNTYHVLHLVAHGCDEHSGFCLVLDGDTEEEIFKAPHEFRKEFDPTPRT